MCVDCVLASPRIAQVDPGDGPPFRGGFVTRVARTRARGSVARGLAHGSRAIA
jgi:hypothetical protein